MTLKQYQSFDALASDLIKSENGRLRDVRITVPLARDIIANGNCINRRFSPSKASGYARDIESGAWNRKKLNTCDVKVEEGRARWADGQHRIKGLIEAADVLGATDAYLDVDVSLVDSLLGQDEGTPRTVRDHLEIMGLDGVLIAPALTKLFRQAANRGGTITEYIRFFEKDDIQALLKQTADQVRRWLAEAKADGVKSPVKATELAITRATSLRGNAGPGVEQRIDEILHDLALGAATNPNVASLLEFFDDNADATKPGKKLALLASVVTATLNNISLTPAQIARQTKKVRRVVRAKKAAAPKSSSSVSKGTTGSMFGASA
jgi:hypothetical protein